MASRVEDAMSDVIRRSEFSRGERRAATKVLDTLTPWVRTCKRRLDH
jgi:hypothetical protein